MEKLTMDERIYLILLEKGLLAIIIVAVAFIFNWLLQSIRLRGEIAKELTAERAAAYKELWKELAEIRPADDEDVTPEKADKIKKVLSDWYHDKANALYMSWKTARSFMLLRKVLAEKSLDSEKIRKHVSLLRTQLKVDCGIYTSLEAYWQLPSPSETADNHTFKK